MIICVYFFDLTHFRGWVRNQKNIFVGFLGELRPRKKSCTQIIPHRATDSAIFASVCLLCINFALLLHTISSCERKCKELVKKRVAKTLPFFLQIFAYTVDIYRDISYKVFSSPNQGNFLLRLQENGLQKVITINIKV